MADLIKMFNLTDEVEKFVRERVRELVAEKHSFSFSGQPSRCGNREPHCPHTTGSYRTVRWGGLDEFCSGVSGATGEGDLVIVTESKHSGSPETPSRLSGYWFLQRPEA